MKNIILGAVIGVGLVFGGYAIAATTGTSGLRLVDQNGALNKVYDSDAKVICYYLDRMGNYGGISCLKHE